MKYLFILLFTLSVFAQNNYSIQFDGGNDLIRYRNTYQATDTEGAWSFWMKTTSNRTLAFIFCLNDTGSGGRHHNISQQTTDNAIGVWSVDVASGNHLLATNDAIDHNQWHHWILGSVGGSSFEIYKDGVLQDTTLIVGDDNGHWYHDIAAINSLSFGGRYLVSGGSTNMIDKTFLDEVCYFDAFPNAAKIAELYNGGVPTTPIGYIDYWNFNEGTGTTTASLGTPITMITETGAIIWSADTPGWDTGYNQKGFNVFKMAKRAKVFK